MNDFENEERDTLNKIKRNLLNISWNIGFLNIDKDFVNKSTWDIRWMKHNYKDRWFADPFILKVTNDEIIVLVEEFYDPIHRGRISKLTIDKQTYELKKIDVILELNSHLSFPAIFRKDDKIYIYPIRKMGWRISPYSGHGIPFKYE